MSTVLTRDEEMALVVRLKKSGMVGAFARLHGATISTEVSRLRVGNKKDGPGPVARARIAKLLPSVERHLRMHRAAMASLNERRERLRAILNALPHAGVKGLPEVPRLRDVARLAEVGLQTLVNFKNGRPFGERNIQRVERALRELKQDGLNHTLKREQRTQKGHDA